MVNKTKPNVAIFGGSFDPPHLAHQQIVNKALDHLDDIDKLLIIPAFLNPFKSSSFAPASKRLEWCQTLFGNLKKAVVSDYEIKEGKSTYTSQTVKHFNQVYNVQYLIIGSDNLATLTKWHDYEWLNENITWVVATRDDYLLDTSKLREWKLLQVDTPISSTQIRESKILEYVDDKIKRSVQNVLKG